MLEDAPVVCENTSIVCEVPVLFIDLLLRLATPKLLRLFQGLLPVLRCKFRSCESRLQGNPCVLGDTVLEAEFQCQPCSCKGKGYRNNFGDRYDSQLSSLLPELEILLVQVPMYAVEYTFASPPNGEGT